MFSTEQRIFFFFPIFLSLSETHTRNLIMISNLNYFFKLAKEPTNTFIISMILISDMVI